MEGTRDEMVVAVMLNETFNTFTFFLSPGSLEGLPNVIPSFSRGDNGKSKRKDVSAETTSIALIRYYRLHDSFGAEVAVGKMSCC